MASGSKKINILIGADTRQLNAALKKSERNLQKFGRRMSLVGTDLIRSVTIPLALAGGALLKFGADLDAQKRALSAVMGSAKLATQHFLELKEAAKAPGLDFSAAVQGSLRFQSMGLSAQTATETLTAFGKAVALSGGGADEFGRTIQQLSDMFSRQKVTMEDWRRVITAAPAVIKALAEEFDGATDAIQIFQEVGFEEFMTRLTRRLNETQGVGGSLKNSFNNLASSSRHLLGEMGLLLDKHTGLSDGIAYVVDWADKLAISLTTNKELAAQWGSAIEKSVKALIAIATIGILTKITGSLALLTLQLRTAARGALNLTAALTGLNVAKGAGLITPAVGSAQIGVNIAAGASAAGGAFAAKFVTVAQAIIRKTLFAVGLVYAVIKGAEAFAIAIARRQGVVGLQESLKWQKTMVDAGVPGAKGMVKRLRKALAEEFAARPLITQEQLGLGTLIGQAPNVGIPKHNLDPLTEDEEKIKKASEAFSDIMDKYRESMKKLRAEFKLIGDPVKFAEGELSNLKKTLVDLEVGGFGAGKAFEGLSKELKDLLGYAEALDSLAKNDDGFFAKLHANDPTIKGMPLSFDANTRLPGDKDANRAALLSSEIASGIDPSEEDKEAQLKHLEALAERTQTLGAAAEGMGEAFAQSFIGIIDGTRTLSDALRDFFKKMMKQLIAAIAKWAILAALTGGGFNLAALGKSIAQSFGFGGIKLGGKGGGGLTVGAEGGMMRKTTDMRLGEYTNAYNKPEMVGRVDQWAGLIEQFMGGKKGGQQSNVVGVIRGQDLLLVLDQANVHSRALGGPTINFGG